MGLINGSPFRIRSQGLRGLPAFTLVELLVVLVVIGLLVALVLPAVQAAREAARRGRCIANLAQLGRAMNSYYTASNMFPPSMLLTGRNYSSNHMSELTFLLPHVEQQPLFNTINMAFVNVESASSPTIENRTARNTRLAVFLCPSDGEPNHLNSYRFNRGRLHATRSGHPFDGPFSIGVLPRAVVITDGLSNTAFVSERLGGSFSPGAFHRVRDIKYPDGGSGQFSSEAEFIGLCLASEPEVWETRSGRYWMYSGGANTHYNHNGTPNDHRPTCSPTGGADWGWDGLGVLGLSPPRSYHPGLVNVLMGDGRAMAVSNSVQPRVWISMGTFDARD